ncbi:MAG TPA: DUF2846 domain-containing protein [Candidatus Angelobacter sp.]
MKIRLSAITVSLIFCFFVCLSSVAQDKDKQEKDEPLTETEKQVEAKACPSTNNNMSAKTDKNSHPTPDAPADKALVYIVRPTMMGNKIQTKLAVDGNWVGVNRGDNYFYLTLEPGTHYFCSQAENRSALALKMEAGKTYYLQQKITMGIMKARNKLVEVDEAKGKEDVAKTHPSSYEVKGTVAEANSNK